MKNAHIGKQLSEYNRLYKENTAIYHDFCVRFGISDSTFWILYTLRAESAPITQSDICAILFQPRQTVNSALKKLEHEGLISLSGKSGRRGKPIHLTQNGLALAMRTVDVVIEAEQNALLDLSPDEQHQMLHGMRRYNAMLSARMREAAIKEDAHE